MPTIKHRRASRRGGVREAWVPLATRTESGSVVVGSHFDDADVLRVQLNVTEAAGENQQLGVTIEDSIDGGANWNSIGGFNLRRDGEGSGFPLLGHEVTNVLAPFGDFLRVSWHISGTVQGVPSTFSFAFAVDAYVK